MVYNSLIWWVREWDKICFPCLDSEMDILRTVYYSVMLGILILNSIYARVGVPRKVYCADKLGGRVGT